MNALIVGRVIAGIGGAGMYLGNLNLLSINTSLRERRVYMGGVGIVWGAGTILGPVVGASFADSGATWRWAFYINLVIYALMLPALFIMPSYQPKPGTNTLTKFKQLDWVGAFLNTRLWTSFVLATTFGGSTWAWGGGRTIAPFVVCLVILIFFALQQSFAILTTPSQLLFPISFLKSRTIVLLSIATTATGIAQFVPIFCVPLFFQFTHSDTGLQAAVPLMPFIALNSFFIMGQGIAMPFVGYYYPFYIVSGILTTTGGALMYTVNEGTSTSAIYGYSVLIAVGAGLIAQAAYSIVPTKVRPGQVSDAIGFINVAQIGGITISLSVSGDVFQNTAFNGLKKVLSGMEFSEADISAAVAGSQSKVFERMSEEVRNRAIEKIVESIDATYGLVITAGAVVVVTSLWLRRERLFMEVSVGGA